MAKFSIQAGKGNWSSRPEGGHAGRSRASGIAPGKKPLTAALPPRPRAAVQAKPAASVAPTPAAPAAAREDWTDVVFRPDLYSEPIQAKSTAMPSGLAGSTGSGSPMEPQLQASMSQSFGTDFSNVRIHEDSTPAQIGAVAYTSGTDIHFNPGHYNPGSTSGRELIGHELAHVVQQAAGRVSVQGKGAQINADPGLEAEADAAGARAARGEPARVQGATGGGVQRQVIQCYTEYLRAGRQLRVAHDGTIAVDQVPFTDYGTQYMWALPSLIETANGVLADKKSVIRLSAGDRTLTGYAPDGSGPKTLSQVIPENVSTKTKGTNMTLWADCGRSGRDVMGAGKGTGEHFTRMTSVYNKEGGTGGKRWGCFPKRVSPELMSPERTTSASDPQKMAAEVYKKLGGKAAYDALSPAEKNAFDKKAGINRYAEPGLGEGYTMAKGGANYPDRTWNFHWGGVIMVSGRDRVTLENYATGSQKEKNTKWKFQMYGPATEPYQTFHDQHKASRQHGDAPTTLRVRKK